MKTVTKALKFNGHVITIPVSDEVAEVINQWARDHADDLNSRLEPYGLGNFDIQQPAWFQVVAADLEPDA